MAEISGMPCALVTSHSSNNQELFELTYPNHREYCERHGYTLFPDEEPYTAYTDTAKVRKLLSNYDIVVTMGVDLWIQRPEIPLSGLANDGITLCRELKGTLNADLIIYKAGQQTIRTLNAIDSFQHKFRDGQQALNRLSKDSRYIIFVNDKLQVAAPIMNPDIDYKDIDVSGYFALHFHKIGSRPIVGSKLSNLKEWLSSER